LLNPHFEIESEKKLPIWRLLLGRRSSYLEAVDRIVKAESSWVVTALS
jgi:hypothetical protein